MKNMETILGLSAGVLLALGAAAFIVFVIWLLVKLTKGGPVSTINPQSPLQTPRPGTRPPAKPRPDKPAVIMRPDYDQDKYNDRPPVFEGGDNEEEIDPAPFWNKVWRIALSSRNNEEVMKNSLNEVEFNYWKSHQDEFIVGAPILYGADGKKRT